MIRRVVPLLFFVLVGPEAWAHKYHASLTRIDLVKDSRAFEITIKLFTDDLEKALQGQAGSAFSIDKGPGVEERTYAYLQDNFTIEDQEGNRLECKWVGMEIEVEVTHIYLEISDRDSFKDLKFRNAIFFELFRDQVNTVNLNEGTSVSTLVFTWGEGSKRIPSRGAP